MFYKHKYSELSALASRKEQEKKCSTLLLPTEHGKLSSSSYKSIGRLRSISICIMLCRFFSLQRMRYEFSTSTRVYFLHRVENRQLRTES